MTSDPRVSAGLEDVVAASTRLSHVDGEAGELIIAGFAVDELAAHATFEETTWLLWHGELPTPVELAAFRAELAAHRTLPAATLALLRECAKARLDHMDALRMGIDSVSLVSSEAVAIVAIAPTIVAAFVRLMSGEEAIAPRSDLGHAANYLYMLSGRVPDPERVRGLETYLNTVVDHGLNASTFACRVIVSTGSDLVSAVVGAIGALKGPLHGGAPGPALQTVFEIGDASRAEQVLRGKIEAGERLMGFGHRVYKVRDPRADVLAAAAERLFTRAGDMRLYNLARAVEATAIKLLEEYKPGRRLQTNVEFYTALLLHGLGLEVPLFTPTFAISRVSGWIAHAIEQRAANRLIRPRSQYVGPRGRRWKVAGVLSSIALIASIWACASAIRTSPLATESALMQADRDFAVATHARGIDGWMSFFAPDAVRIRYRGNMVKGSDAIRAFDVATISDTTTTLNWEPTDASVFRGGEIGSTTGRYSVVSRRSTDAGKELGHGRYVTIWRRDGARWLVIMDTGYPEP